MQLLFVLPGFSYFVSTDRRKCEKRWVSIKTGKYRAVHRECVAFLEKKYRFLQLMSTGQISHLVFRICSQNILDVRIHVLTQVSQANLSCVCNYKWKKKKQLGKRFISHGALHYKRFEKLIGETFLIYKNDFATPLVLGQAVINMYTLKNKCWL